jgi:acyl carrier protein
MGGTLDIEAQPASPPDVALYGEVSPLLQRVRDVVTRIVPGAAALSSNADLRALDQWDSLAALRVLVALEGALGVSLPTDLFATPRTLEALAELALSLDFAHARLRQT